METMISPMITQRRVQQLSVFIFFNVSTSVKYFKLHLNSPKFNGIYW